jgi:hypothetical protein
VIVIAFNTECSRDFGTHCEMCSFGYVVADANLSVEISRKVPIKASKPTGRQKKSVRTPYEKFKDAPEYTSIYPSIKDIFEQKDAIFISSSPETDFRYLCCMNRRYGTQQINCKAYDILSIFRNYARGDYLPKMDGPLVNAGTNYEDMAATDLAGRQRKVGKFVDIGCYENGPSKLHISIR